MAAPVENGNDILIPLFDGAALGQPIIVKWQQDFQQRQEGYYQVVADNMVTGKLPPKSLKDDSGHNLTAF